MSCQWTVELPMSRTSQWRLRSPREVRWFSRAQHESRQKGTSVKHLNIQSKNTISHHVSSPPAPAGVLQQMLQARRQPRLIIKLKSTSSQIRKQLWWEHQRERKKTKQNYRPWRSAMDHVISASIILYINLYHIHLETSISPSIT